MKNSVATNFGIKAKFLDKAVVEITVTDFHTGEVNVLRWAFKSKSAPEEVKSHD